MAQCSGARAGRIGLGDTPRYLTDRGASGNPSVEAPTVALMREAKLRSFNDYREAFSLPRVDDFDDLTSDADLQRRLRDLYPTIDDVEWYVGIFARTTRTTA